MWLVKCLKSLVSEHLATVSMLSSLKKWNKALPSYIFITLAKIELENVGFSVFEVLRVFANTLTANDRYSFRNRNNLQQPNQLQLSKKHKIFS